MGTVTFTNGTGRKATIRRTSPRDFGRMEPAVGRQLMHRGAPLFRRFNGYTDGTVRQAIHRAVYWQVCLVVDLVVYQAVNMEINHGS
jgi:hypothetical protein